jgi:hypothetical protein
MTGGAPATGGVPATGGASATGGTPGTGGGGTNPCAGLCASPTVIATLTFSSDAIGTAEVCYETTLSLIGGNCGNIGSRTFSINGTATPCDGNVAATLLSDSNQRNDGFCFHFTAGDPDYTYFGVW